MPHQQVRSSQKPTEVRSDWSEKVGKGRGVGCECVYVRGGWLAWGRCMFGGGGGGGVFVECSPLLGLYYVSTTILLNPASSTPFMCNSSCKWLHWPFFPMGEVGGGILLSVYHPTTLSPNSCMHTKVQIIIPSYIFTVSRAGGSVENYVRHPNSFIQSEVSITKTTENTQSQKH